MTALDQLTRTLSVPQIRSLVTSTEKQIALWSGAVSAGKTFISLWAFLIAIMHAPRSGNIIIVGRTLDTIYSNVFVLLLNPDIFGELSKQVRYTRGAKTATILGREVLLYGANDASSESKIRGSTVALAYVDEVTILPEGFWDMLMTRLRVAGARVLATTNPGSQNHWLRKKWILQADAKDLIHFHFTMDDNPSLEPAYVANTKARFAGVFYDRFVLGLWTNAAGAIYPMWDQKRHVVPFDRLPDISRVFAVGVDYGTTNTTAALMLGLTAEPQPRLVFMDEWSYSSREHHGHTLSDDKLAHGLIGWLAEDHHPRYTPAPEFLFFDPSAASFRTRMRELGHTTWPAEHDVMPGIGDVANLLDTGKLIISDRCKGLMSEITEYRWSEKATDKGLDEVVKEDDHFMDAMRYAVRSSKNLWHPYLAYQPIQSAA